MLKWVTPICAAVVVDAASIITGRPAAHPSQSRACRCPSRQSSRIIKVQKRTITKVNSRAARAKLGVTDIERTAKSVQGVVGKRLTYRIPHAA